MWAVLDQRTIDEIVAQSLEGGVDWFDTARSTATDAPNVLSLPLCTTSACDPARPWWPPSGGRSYGPRPTSRAPSMPGGTACRATRSTSTRCTSPGASPRSAPRCGRWPGLPAAVAFVRSGSATSRPPRCGGPARRSARRAWSWHRTRCRSASWTGASNERRARDGQETRHHAHRLLAACPGPVEREVPRRSPAGRISAHEIGGSASVLPAAPIGRATSRAPDH